MPVIARGAHGAHSTSLRAARPSGSASAAQTANSCQGWAPLLVGLAEVGEQAADREQREQAERRARGPPIERADTHRDDECFAEREAPSFERLPQLAAIQKTMPSPPLRPLFWRRRA